MSEPSEPSELTMIMPFVLCKSVDGPYDDDAFVAGYTCATLDAELRALALYNATPHRRMVNAAYLPQVDLIAMQHGYTTRLGDLDEPSGWQVVTFEHGACTPDHGDDDR